MIEITRSPGAGAPLAGRVALVTGGSRGIGKGIALALARDGADVAINYRRDNKAADEVVAEIRALGRRGMAYQASIQNWEESCALIESVVQDFGAIGILVNNAGIASRGNAVVDTDPAELERVMSIHAFAPFYLCKQALPHMRREVRGDIIMISSVATRMHAPNGSPYTMAKASVEALALTLAKEERKYGIRTNIVAPSLTVTDMGTRLATAAFGVSNIHELDAHSPFGRVSTPADVAQVVAYLVSDHNAYVNGQKIDVDGGG